MVGFVNALAGRTDIVCVKRACQAQGAEACLFELLPAEAAGDVPAIAYNPDPALGRQLNLLELFFDRMPMGIAILDRDYRIRRYNPTWAEFADRYAPPSAAPIAPGVYYFDFLPGTEPTVLPLFEQVLAGETLRLESVRLESEGVVTYWDVVLAPIVEGEEVTSILSVTIDATERVQARQELEETLEKLRQREERLALVMEGINDGVWDWDLESGNVYFSPRWKSMLGYAVDELPNEFESWQSLIHPDDRERASDAIQENLDGRTPLYWLEHRLRHRDGEYRWILARGKALRRDDGTPYRLVGSHTDISERKLAEEALQESRRRLRTLISNLPGMAYRCRNDADWTMEFVSEGALELTGYPPHGLIGSKDVSYGELIHPDDRDMVWKGVQTALEEERPFQLTYRLITPQGEKWIWEQGRGVPDAGGRVIALEGFATDITERVMAQRHLEQRVEERTHELSTLLEVSHNVNSTLDLGSLLDLILDQLRTVVEYTGASILTLDEGYLSVQAYRGPIPQDRALALRFSLEEAPVNHQVIRQREPLVIPDIRDNTRLARMFRQTAGGDLKSIFSYVRSWLGVPLTVKGEVLGMLTLDHSEPDFFAAHRAGLVLTFANQVAVALENARLYAQAEGAAVAAERSRLARDLHDAVTQTLFSSTLIAEVLPRLWERNPDEARRRLTELRELTRGALAEMRTLLLELRPSALKEANLADLLRQLAESITGRARVPVALEVEGECSLEAGVKIALYRIAQEALNNVAKHAGANAATLRLSCQPGLVELQVSDDGLGFDPANLSPNSLGLGIMRERAEAIGAALTVESQPGAGTEITVLWRSSNQ
jgi:two-component system nitrate/nitrite sensor histidine kinase NarX